MNAQSLVFYREMRDKAADELAALTGKDKPMTECAVKEILGCALRHLTPEEAGKVVAEACEWLCCNLKVCKHEWLTELFAQSATTTKVLGTV